MQPWNDYQVVWVVDGLRTGHVMAIFFDILWWIFFTNTDKKVTGWEHKWGRPTDLKVTGREKKKEKQKHGDKVRERRQQDQESTRE